MTTRASIAELAHTAVSEMRAQQQLGELVRFLGCRTGLEIGTYSGGTAWFFAELGARMTVVDHDLSNLYVRRDDVEYYEVLSWDWAEQHPARTFDFVLQDGSHQYAGVKRDWEAFACRISSPGLMAFHDIVEHDPPQDCHVDKFWAQMRARTDLTIREIIEPPVGWGGIGVVLL
jgi:predicted O-methyltransferase YrrM